MEIKESPNTEIRNLREGTILSLLQILNTVTNDWERFMFLIPMDPQKEKFEPKYNSEHVRLIHKHAEETKLDPVKILFDEWGTSGQIRPTLRTVQQIALKAEMMRLADEIADMLGEPHPPRPTQGPGAPVTEDISDLNLNDTSLEIRDTTKEMGSEANGMEVPNWDELLRSGNNLQSSTKEMRSELNGTGIPNWDELLRSGNNVQSTTKQMGSEANGTGLSNWGELLRSVNNLQSSENQECSQSDYQHSLPNISLLQNIGNYSVTNRIDPTILQDTNLIHYNYSDLEAITDNFSDAFKIGTGGFGDVFKAQTSDGMLAIKRARMQWQQHPEEMMVSFNNEVKYLSQFRHENIVPILGFTKGPMPCIVCEYIAGGSLYEKIAERVLSEKQRLALMRGTAEGLRYLHSNHAEPGLGDPSARGLSRTNFVHGDVKSANILLTLDFVPKLCDFGLTKQYDYTFIQPIVIGTKVYMAPEALTGSVTPKSDIYSYGIVLLELLTALRPRLIVDGNEIDIKLHVYEGISRYGKTIFDYLDRSAEWRWAGQVFALATQCLQYDRQNRPDSELICRILSALQNN